MKRPDEVRQCKGPAPARDQRETAVEGGESNRTELLSDEAEKNTWPLHAKPAKRLVITREERETLPFFFFFFFSFLFFFFYLGIILFHIDTNAACNPSNLSFLKTALLVSENRIVSSIAQNMRA